MSENYSTVRKLASVEHLGATFHVVRKRINGKPWRKYLTLTHDGVKVADGFGRADGMTDPLAFADWAKEQLSRLYPTPGEREAMFTELASIKGHCRPAR